jgi:hypothetical protein
MRRRERGRILSGADTCEVCGKCHTHLKERLCRERVCEREEPLSLRVDFFPEVERDVVCMLVSAHGPDLLGFEDNEHLHMTCSVVGLLTPMNHSLQETMVSAAY